MIVVVVVVVVVLVKEATAGVLLVSNSSGVSWRCSAGNTSWAKRLTAFFASSSLQYATMCKRTFLT